MEDKNRWSLSHGPVFNTSLLGLRDDIHRVASFVLFIRLCTIVFQGILHLFSSMRRIDGLLSWPGCESQRTISLSSLPDGCPIRELLPSSCLFIYRATICCPNDAYPDLSVHLR